MKLDKTAAEKAYKAVYTERYVWDDDADTASDPLTRIVTAPSVADAQLAMERAVAESQWCPLNRSDGERLRAEYLKLTPPYVDGEAAVEVVTDGNAWMVAARAETSGFVSIFKRVMNQHGDWANAYRGMVNKDGAFVTNAETGSIPLKVLRAAYDLRERTGGVA